MVYLIGIVEWYSGDEDAIGFLFTVGVDGIVEMKQNVLERD